MGKDLKGREIGEGVRQRSDGYFVARFTNRSGKRVTKYFDNVTDAKKWILTVKYEDMTDEHIAPQYSMTVDEWFEYWIKNFKKDLSPNTIRNYKERYYRNAREVIGDMLLSEVKGVHCQKILNDMRDTYSRRTIYQAYICLGTMFKCALKNELIEKHPLDSVELRLKNMKRKQVRALTIEEQQLFLQSAEKTRMSKQFRLILNTGLRTGELIGLKWSDIDFENRTMKIERTMEFRYKVGEWRVGPPKSKSGYRTIPLTDEAIRILENQRAKNKKLKLIPIEWNDTVFLCRNGTPVKNSTYDTGLFKYCDHVGIPHFSMHVLRHTFATRCIEGGMKPKTLQKILGHSNIGITMNLYVHITEDEKHREIDLVADALKVI